MQARHHKHQTFSRTMIEPFCRQGNKGTAQLVIQSPRVDIHTLRDRRTRLEEERIRKAKTDVVAIEEKDKMFKRYCDLQGELLPTTTESRKRGQRIKLEINFKEYLTALEERM